jgi:hypothetical protein
MPKVIPHGADTDESYELNANMTDAEGNTYYKRKVPTPPVTIDKSDPTKVTIASKTGRS